MPSSPIGRRNMWRRVRAAVYTRDGGKCQYCWRQLTPETFHLDHVTPRSLGGTNAQTNLVVSCQPCQHWKDDRTIWQLGLPDWHLMALTPTYLANKRAMIEPELDPVFDAIREGRYTKGQSMRRQ